MPLEQRNCDPLFMALRSGACAPARDAADTAFQPAAGETDYAGSPRLQGNAVDLGALEPDERREGISWTSRILVITIDLCHGAG